MNVYLVETLLKNSVIIIDYELSITCHSTHVYSPVYKVSLKYSNNSHRFENILNPHCMGVGIVQPVL
jgi:hypothetical protein